MTETMSIASTILEQLGGNKFIAMTGASHFVSDGKHFENDTSQKRKQGQPPLYHA